jgi:hypothetical protein
VISPWSLTRPFISTTVDPDAPPIMRVSFRAPGTQARRAGAPASLVPGPDAKTRRTGPAWEGSSCPSPTRQCGAAEGAGWGSRSGTPLPGSDGT